MARLCLTIISKQSSHTCYERSLNDAIHLLLQSPTADEIVTLVDQIITVQGQISEQFPQIFENIVKENLAKNITSSLNNIYQTQSLALQNLREIEDLETKIIYFRILYDTNLPMPKDKYVYPVPPQEENEIVSAQTQNDRN